MDFFNYKLSRLNISRLSNLNIEKALTSENEAVKKYAAIKNYQSKNKAIQHHITIYKPTKDNKK